MEKPTEPNESNLKEGLIKTSEINTGKSEEKQVHEPQAGNKTVKKKIDFDALKLEVYPEVLKKLISSEQWIKKGKEIQEVVAQFESRFGKILSDKKKKIRRTRRK